MLRMLRMEALSFRNPFMTASLLRTLLLLAVCVSKYVLRNCVCVCLCPLAALTLPSMSRGYSSLKETRHSHLNVRVEQMDRRTAARVALRRGPRLIAPIMQRMMDGRRTPRRLLAKGGGSSSDGGSGGQQRAYA